MRNISIRTCRICGSGGNPIIASEQPCALWNISPWMPEGHYTLIRCRRCGNLYVDSDVTEEYLDSLMAEDVPEMKTKTIYGMNQEYELVRNEELKLNWAMIKKMRNPKIGEHLLDLGSAWGAFGSIVQQDGIIPNGIELQPEAVMSSLKLWGEGKVHDGPIYNAPFSKGEFQYITSFETLEHLFDPIKTLKELKRLLSEDGVLAISVPSADYFIFKYWLYRKQPFSAWMREHMPGNMEGGRALVHNHINTFSVKSAKVMMEKAGLKTIYVSSIGWRGGRIGKICRSIGSLLWICSRYNIAFAPSIFIVANNKI